MVKRSISLLCIVLLVIFIFGCAGGVPRLGTGGKGSAQKIETGHPDTPEGVNCYVCHKEDIPEESFHAAYNTQCEDCHGKTTWIAYKYPHESWGLGLHRQFQCNRCHSKMDVYDFSTWQCWGCHHEQPVLAESHAKLGFKDIENCIACHTTIPETIEE